MSYDFLDKLSSIQPEDADFMAMAINLAWQGIFITRPNPSVGCVIVKEGRVVGTGRTDKVGGFHAEVFALQKAADQAQGATAYVTLEPCSHTGRTPPCCDALIAAGIARVVVALIDPNPKVAGRGIKRLLAAGITVSLGLMADEARCINRGFLKAMATGLPFVSIKLATSLDGRVAMASGESKWITSKAARLDVQRHRARAAAIITGSQTIIKDNPALNVRGWQGLINIADGYNDIDVKQIPQPKIVVMDRRAQLDYHSPYQVLKRNDTLLWRDDIQSLLLSLVKDFQCYDVMVEAGATLATAFLQSGLVDELVLYQAGCLLGVNTQPMFQASFEHLSQGLRLYPKATTLIGEDIKTVFSLTKATTIKYKLSTA